MAEFAQPHEKLLNTKPADNFINFGVRDEEFCHNSSFSEALLFEEFSFFVVVVIALISRCSSQITWL